MSEQTETLILSVFFFINSVILLGTSLYIDDFYFKLLGLVLGVYTMCFANSLLMKLE